MNRGWYILTGIACIVAASLGWAFTSHKPARPSTVDTCENLVSYSLIETGHRIVGHIAVAEQNDTTVALRINSDIYSGLITCTFRDNYVVAIKSH